MLTLFAVLLGAFLLGHGLVPDTGGVVSLAEDFLPWSGMLVLLLLVLAGVRRSALALVAAAALGAVWCVQFLPLALPHSEPGTAALTAVSENITGSNPAPLATVRSLQARHPDVLALQEMSASARGRIEDALARSYPYREVVGTVGVWSTLPLSDAEPLSLGLGWDRALRVDVATSEGAVRLYVVHADSVRPGLHSGRDTMLAALTATVRADPSKRLVVLGDLNSASTDRQFTQLRSVLSEATTTTPGFGFTWPAPFPVVRIDHALTRGLTTLTSVVLPANGSNHLGIEVRLR